MNNNNVYKKIEEHVKALFAEKMKPALVFHNLHHTEAVVARVKEIAAHYSLSEKEMLTLFAASWFHDTGHLFCDPVGHEEKSVEIMRSYLTANRMDDVFIKDAGQIILATRTPRNPENLLEEIMCDADTYHFGTKEFKVTNLAAMEEVKLRTGKLDMADFNKKTIEMLQTHRFYTTYCKNLLSTTKEKNMKKQKKKHAGIDNEEEPLQANPDIATNLSNLVKDKSGLMSKGIQTMLRLTSENHLKLSDMADNKANILITVNSIIISVILTLLLRKLPDEPYLLIPSILFLTISVSTIVVSILATRPKISGGTFTQQDIADKKTNLLFFGNFHKATFDDYNSAMRNMMVDTDYLYGSLIKDIYNLGTVLGKKYKLLRIAYNIFMIGIVLSVIAFALAVILNQHNAQNSPRVITGKGSPL